jgi:glycosyltransferase involved in cell wall biosynthesis
VGVSVVRTIPTLRPPTAIPLPRRSEWPSVGVVVATRDRPNLVRRALDSIRDQDYPGMVRVVVVFDGARPDWRLARAGDRPVLVLENWRTPGLVGARNTGILAVGDCDLVAVCDDDDTWARSKLTVQVAAMRPETLFATCAAEVEFDGRRTARLLGRRTLDVDRMARTPAGLLCRSGFLARHQALVTSHVRGGIGLLAENAPAGGEDWDLLMRAARRGPVVHVDAPLVRVLWRPAPTHPRRDVDRVNALLWLLSRHPEIETQPAAAVRVLDEIACWYAVAGNTTAAWAWALRGLRSRWWDRHNVVAMAAAAGIVPRHRLRTVLGRDRLP